MCTDPDIPGGEMVGTDGKLKPAVMDEPERTGVTGSAVGAAAVTWRERLLAWAGDRQGGLVGRCEQALVVRHEGDGRPAKLGGQHLGGGQVNRVE